MPYPKTKKFISGLVLFLFLGSELARSAPQTAFQGSAVPFSLPAELGTIEETHLPSSQGPFIFHLQTAHAHYEGALKVREIIHYLQKQYQADLLFVEGASIPLRADFLRFFPDAKLNFKMAFALAEKGGLTGADLSLLDHPTRTVGIEEPLLYRAAYQSFKTVVRDLDQSETFLESERARLDKEASKVFSQELRKLWGEWWKFQSGERDLLATIKFFKEEAKEPLLLDFEDPNSQFEWPQLVRLILLEQLERRFDPEALEKDKKEITNWLRKKRVSKHFIEGFPTLGGENPRRFFEEFLKETYPHGFRFHDYRAWTYFAASQVLRSELEAKGLFKECERLFGQLFEARTKTKKERELLEGYRRLLLLKKLLRLELTREEWGQIKEKGIESGAPSLAEALRFYRLTERRESAFLKKLTEELGKQRSQKAILVTGGFHTEGLAAGLRKRGIGFATVVPRISTEGENSLYHKVMLQRSHLERGSELQSAAALVRQGWDVDLGLRLVEETTKEVAGRVNRFAPYFRDRDEFLASSKAEKKRSELRHRRTPGEGLKERFALLVDQELKRKYAIYRSRLKQITLKRFERREDPFQGEFESLKLQYYEEIIERFERPLPALMALVSLLWLKLAEIVGLSRDGGFTLLALGNAADRIKKEYPELRGIASHNNLLLEMAERLTVPLEAELKKALKSLLRIESQSLDLRRPFRLSEARELLKFPAHARALFLHRLAERLETGDPSTQTRAEEVLRAYLTDRLEEFQGLIFEFVDHLVERVKKEDVTLVFIGRGTEQLQLITEIAASRQGIDLSSKIKQVVVSRTLIETYSEPQIRDYLEKEGFSGLKKVLFVDAGFSGRVAQVLARIAAGLGAEPEVALLILLDPADRKSPFRIYGQNPNFEFAHTLSEVSSIRRYQLTAHLLDNEMGKQFEHVWELAEGTPVLLPTKTPRYHRLTTEVVKEFTEQYYRRRSLPEIPAEQPSARSEVREDSYGTTVLLPVRNGHVHSLEIGVKKLFPAEPFYSIRLTLTAYQVLNRVKVPKGRAPSLKQNLKMVDFFSEMIGTGIKTRKEAEAAVGILAAEANKRAKQGESWIVSDGKKARVYGAFAKWVKNEYPAPLVSIAPKPLGRSELRADGAFYPVRHLLNQLKTRGRYNDAVANGRPEEGHWNVVALVVGDRLVSIEEYLFHLNGTAYREFVLARVRHWDPQNPIFDDTTILATLSLPKDQFMEQRKSRILSVGPDRVEEMSRELQEGKPLNEVLGAAARSEVHQDPTDPGTPQSLPRSEARAEIRNEDDSAKESETRLGSRRRVSVHKSHKRDDVEIEIGGQPSLTASSTEELARKLKGLGFDVLKGGGDEISFAGPKEYQAVKFSNLTELQNALEAAIGRVEDYWKEPNSRRDVSFRYYGVGDQITKVTFRMEKKDPPFLGGPEEAKKALLDYFYQFQFDRDKILGAQTQESGQFLFENSFNYRIRLEPGPSHFIFRFKVDREESGYTNLSELLTGVIEFPLSRSEAHPAGARPGTPPSSPRSETRAEARSEAEMPAFRAAEMVPPTLKEPEVVASKIELKEFVPGLGDTELKVSATFDDLPEMLLLRVGVLLGTEPTWGFRVERSSQGYIMKLINAKGKVLQKVPFPMVVYFALRNEMEKRLDALHRGPKGLVEYKTIHQKRKRPDPLLYFEVKKRGALIVTEGGLAARAEVPPNPIDSGTPQSLPRSEARAEVRTGTRRSLVNQEGALIDKYSRMILDSKDRKVILEMAAEYDYRSKAAHAPTPKAWFFWALTWAKMALDKANRSNREVKERTVVLARDARKIEPEVMEALAAGFALAGFRVIHISAKRPSSATTYGWALTQHRPLVGVFVTPPNSTDSEEAKFRGARVSIQDEGGRLASLTNYEVKTVSRAIIANFMAVAYAKNKTKHHPEFEEIPNGRIQEEDLSDTVVRVNALLGRVANGATPKTLYDLARAWENPQRDPLETLAEWEAIAGRKLPLQGTPVVIDGVHTESGPLAAKAFEALGAEVELLRGEVKDLEETHWTDPSRSENLELLKSKMEETQAPLGLAFDLNGDRSVLVIRKGEGEFIEVATDQLTQILLPLLLTSGGYDRKKLGRIAILGDILSTQGLQETARLYKIAYGRTESGYIFLNELVKKARRQGFTIPIRQERSGHIWLDVTGDYENPIAVAVLYAVMAQKLNEADSRVTNPFLALYRKHPFPYKGSRRFQPPFRPEFLKTLAHLSKNHKDYEYRPNAIPPQELIDLGRHQVIRALMREFKEGGSYKTPAGPLIVSKIETKKDSNGIYRFAVIHFQDLDKKDAGRFVLRTSANEPTFVATYETPVHTKEGETLQSPSVVLRYISVGGVVLYLLEKAKIAQFEGKEVKDSNVLIEAESLRAFRTFLGARSEVRRAPTGLGREAASQLTRVKRSEIRALEIPFALGGDGAALLVPEFLAGIGTFGITPVAWRLETKRAFLNLIQAEHRKQVLRGRSEEEFSQTVEALDDVTLDGFNLGPEIQAEETPVILFVDERALDPNDQAALESRLRELPDGSEIIALSDLSAGERGDILGSLMSKFQKLRYERETYLGKLDLDQVVAKVKAKAALTKISLENTGFLFSRIDLLESGTGDVESKLKEFGIALQFDPRGLPDDYRGTPGVSAAIVGELAEYAALRSEVRNRLLAEARAEGVFGFSQGAYSLHLDLWLDARRGELVSRSA